MRSLDGDSLLGFGDFFSEGVSEREAGADGQADGISVGGGALEAFLDDGVSERESGAHGRADGVEIGAIVPRRNVPGKPVASAPGKSVPGKPTGKKIPLKKGYMKSRKVSGKGKASPHMAAMANAAMAGKKAIAAAQKGKSHVAKYTKALAAGKHAPGVALTAIGFNSRGEVVLGAANPKVAKVLTPKQRVAVQKHVQAAARLSAAQKALAAATVNAKKKGEAAKAFVVKAIPVVKKALVIKPFTGPTHIGLAQTYINQRGGVGNLTDEEVIGLTEFVADGISGEQTEIGYLDQGFEGQSGQMTEIGYLDQGFEGRSGEQTEIGNVEIGVDAQGLSPGQPGYDASTDIDAMMAQGGAGAVDPSTGLPMSGGASGLASADSGTGQVLDPQGNVLYDPATDPAVIPMPVRGQDLTPEELSEEWQHVPDDGFVYGASEGGKQYPPNSVGSANVFLDAAKNAHGWGHGYIFGGQDWMFPTADSGDGFNTFDHGHFGSTAEIQGYSRQHGWGPLAGNPAGELKNLQYATVDKKWFWQGKAAPLAYSAEADAKIAQANQATIAANRAAAVVLAKQMQADQAAAAEAQAKQDAANALAESAAQSQMNVAAAAQTVQQGQLDLQTQQQQLADQALQSQMAQQSAQVQTQAQQALIEQAKQQAQVQAQAQQALIDQASVYNKWAAANPDQAVAQMQAEDMQAEMQDAQAPMQDEQQAVGPGPDDEEAPIEDSDFPMDTDDSYSDFGDLGVRRNNDLIDSGDWE